MASICECHNHGDGSDRLKVKSNLTRALCGDESLSLRPAASELVPLPPALICNSTFTFLCSLFLLASPIEQRYPLLLIHTASDYTLYRRSDILFAKQSLLASC